ncbi:hypothetical protein ASE04_29740 [Rhizobium sp. Root708]|uniref:hypothetical protein n=1 Tax=Rhizobium sp. Root708 TaxID=1736592 RepID=UPI0006FF8BE5|nr:hypothetical protein [Rhizobium sp. Root708]KRB52502.1 hypothetical protein ASE04_29740 [Rhizobium sp. Root708]
MSDRENTKRFTARDRRDFGANDQRPDGNPSAKELIADAVAARADIAVPIAGARAANESCETKKPRHRFTKRRNTEADDKRLAVGDLPTMRELEQARTDHGRKIASRENETPPRNLTEKPRSE